MNNMRMGLLRAMDNLDSSAERRRRQLTTPNDMIKQAFDSNCNSVTVYYKDQFNNSRELTFNTWKEYTLNSPTNFDNFSVDY